MRLATVRRLVHPIVFFDRLYASLLTNFDQIWTTYMYDGGAPRYVLAMSVNSGFALAGIALAIFMRLVLIRENKKLALAEAQNNASEGDTDRQVQSFRYVT